jgi:NitT/TauT family transport system substrate-binding protein
MEEETHVIHGRFKRLVCGAFLCLSLAGATAGNATAASDIVRIGIVPGEFSAQPWYADETGIFAKRGLTVDIEPVTSGSAAIAALAAGSLDVVFSNVLSAAIAYQHGIPLTAIAVANIYTPQDWGSGVLAVQRTSDLNSAKSFSGKTIAVNGLHNAMELGARNWIDTRGGDSNTVKWVEIPDFQQESALMSGRIDAAVMSAGVYPSLGQSDYPIRVVAPALGSLAPTFAVDVWVTSTDWLAKHPDDARAFAAAMRESATWANVHHHETALILANHIKRTVPEIESSVRYIYGTSLTPASLQPQIDAAIRYGWLKPFSAPALIAPIAAVR